MPRLQVLPPGYSFSGELGKALGSAGTAFGESMQKAFSDHLKQKDDYSKNVGVFNSALNKMFKTEGMLEGYDFEDRKKIFDFGDALLKTGKVDPVHAAIHAIDYSRNPDKYADIAKELGIGQAKTPEKETIKKTLAEPTASFEEQNKRALEEEKKRPFTPPTKPIAAMTPQEIVALPTDYVKSLPFDQQVEISKKLGEAGKMGTQLAFTKGLDPTGIVQGAERKMQQAGMSPFLPETPFNRGALGIAEDAGTTLKTLALLNLVGGMGAPGALGTAQRALGGGGLFAASQAAKTAIGEGRHPSVGEVAEEGAFIGATSIAAEAIPALWNMLKRIPKASTAVKEAAKASGVAEEKIVEQAASNLEKRGVNVIKATEGDAATLNELQKETNKVAKQFQETAKFDQKAAEKVREETGKKLVESPLEEYYEPKKEVKSRPETIAKEAERTKKLGGEKALKQRHLEAFQRSVIEGENALKAARAEKASADTIQRIEAKLASDRNQHAKLLNEIKNIEFEVKHGRPPKTTEEIGQQIEKSFADLREGIKNPSVEKLEKVREGIERDKKVVEQAQKLIARGEIPGPQVFDEYIKIHEQYQKAYGELAKELKEFVRANKAVKARANQVRNAEELLKLVNQMEETSAAKIAKQVDKRRAMRAIDKPSGAFYRNMLKDLKKDIQAFQKDIFRYGKIASPEEAKVAGKAKEVLGKPKEVAKIELSSPESAYKAAKNPTPENSAKIDQALGQPKGRTENFIDGLKKDVKAMGVDVKSGNPPSAEKIDTFTDKLIKRLKFQGRRIAGGIRAGLILGTAQALIEEYSGYKIPQSILSLISAGGGKGFAGRGSSFGLGNIVHIQINNAFDRANADELRKLRNTPEFNKRRKQFEEKYSQARANKIVKLAIS